MYRGGVAGKNILFHINMELHDGKNERINYHEDESPEELAFGFCKAKGLNKKVYSFIV